MLTDREQIAANWSKRGFSCELWEDAPGQRWEGFTHATDEVVIVLEGRNGIRSRRTSASSADW